MKDYLTHQQMKRMEYCYLHPLFHEKKIRTEICERCGQRRYIREMREIGFEVFVCRSCK